MPTAIAIPLALITSAIGIAGFLLNRKRYRESKLVELRAKHQELEQSPEGEQSLEATVRFLKTLEKYRRKGALRISDLHEEFGDWFFSTVHCPHGIDQFLGIDEFMTIKQLYRAWIRYCLRNTKEIRDDFDTPVARRWARQMNEHHTNHRILWHHVIQEHEKLGAARLIFWRLGFEPSYDQEQIHNSIDEVCEDFEVSSYVAYELLGPHDILLRLWLSHPDAPSEATEPDGSSMSRVEHVTQRLSEHTPESSNDYFRVEHVHRHWWWTERRWPRSDDPREPDDGFVSVILEGNDKKGSDKKIVKALVNHYNDGTIPGWYLLRSRAWHQYRRKGYIRRRKLHGGIKFATIVRPKDANQTGTTLKGEHPIAMAVIKAKRIRNRSLYEGDGFHSLGLGPAQFLILGRVAGRSFGKLRTEIIDPIVKGEDISKRYAPTLTYVATGPETMRQTYRDGFKHHP